jgi:hypothetical protein
MKLIKIVGFIIILGIAFSAFTIYRGKSEPKIIEIAKELDVVNEFIKENPTFTVEVTQLGNISNLSEKYPAIYGNLNHQNLYQVQFKSDSSGILVIVDLEKRKVVRSFKTLNLEI